MLSKIIQFSIKNKLIIGLMVLGLICWGTYSLTKLPIDAVTDITDNQVMVITTSPTLAAQEVEKLVTFPVEQTMANIPGIKNMRSFSRFGLSIVTIVFEENVDLYWARQQVQERLTVAEKDIPAGVGKPEMAPVTTGLGEIYQYVVHTEKGYEDKYDATELRSIQDWIIKRQLIGTPGVAEVSGFGGYVKQYEISVDPDRLFSVGVNIAEIFEALEKNNQNTGGAYIDKNPYAYFIRSEGLVKNLDELNKIVIKSSENGTPILIRDVATVKFGHSVRYGAATRNGEGEVVTGIVMMLKGANSSEVITNVKEKIEQIKKSLPKGVTIEPFLDRKKLVDSAIQTVAINLAEGALIVLFVLILFLGSVRSGLIVASVIPLSLLFAVSMMNLFGISGNLMSLGAIDFGLIVDGTVIIVEGAIHQISQSKYKLPGIRKLTGAQMDEEVYNTSLKIMSSAAFGTIIILIVYLPLLTLIGVEGKMFRPMAETVSFAILGALILSLTYVPMISTLALSRKTTHKENFSDKLMRFIQRIYAPVIEGALRKKRTVVGIATSAFIISIIVFTNMGGEFIPQLDEGDFAVETRVPVGSSMQQMIDVSKKAQDILLKYPEVDQVVNKIGSGEIPTDPMPIEAGDMMVILKPRKEWTSASSREELIEKMQESLVVIPNASFSFQQPIQMRFNELLTGAKQDVVIKIYGEDLDMLSELATKIGKKIRNVEGAEDLYVEEVTGLPQIQIEFNRDKISQYALNIVDVNNSIETAFAGKAAGLVFEGERRFDLVVRLDSASRADITDVQNLYIPTSSGLQVPLSELATVSYKPGPVQIQRDNAKRRITIGFNVRNRDVKSIVSDITQTIDSQVVLPPGYYITYGGQFQNLEEASQRLAIAVPAALLLILLLLYFTFGSVKQSLLIFTAIPLSAIGGIFALIIRGMPFSISAGVGFIALFGVAVLNGIVLIAEFNRLRKEGVEDPYERVRKGTVVRLRPVLMTAMVASLGFLPMALSTSSGAEVQRPLATVVIGGLITATCLTLVVLPVLYIYFSSSYKNKRKIKSAGLVTSLLIGSFLFQSQNVNAQSITSYPERKISLEQAIEEALQNNKEMKIADYDVKMQQSLKNGGISIPKTEFSLSNGSTSNPDERDNIISVSQRIDFPTLYSDQYKLGKEKVLSSEKLKVVKQNELISNVKSAYLQYLYYTEIQKLLKHQKELYDSLEKSSIKRYQTGESTKLESVTSSVQSMQIKNKLQQNSSDLIIAKRQLQVLLNTDDNVIIADTVLTPSITLLPLDTLIIGNNPTLEYLKQELNVSKRETRVERSRMLPDFILGYNSQTYKGIQSASDVNKFYTGRDRFSYFSIGVAVPIYFGGFRSKVKAAKINESIVQTRIDLVNTQQQGELQKLIQQYYKLKATLNYYQNEALPQAELIINNSEAGFKSGDISYTQLSMNLSLANNIKSEYLDNLYQYNLSVIAIETLLGNNNIKNK